MTVFVGADVQGGERIGDHPIPVRLIDLAGGFHHSSEFLPFRVGLRNGLLEAVQNLVNEVIQEFDHLDILINNAGMNWDGVVWKMTEEQWDKVIDVDLKGTFNFIRAVAPLLREQKSGKIINITSINGLRGKFGQSNYSAAKAGTIGLTKTVAREMGKYNVNVNSVAPGMILTDMFKDLPEEFKQKAADETVFNRLGYPEDVAHVVTFLASDKSRHITGEVIKVDGGQYI